MVAAVSVTELVDELPLLEERSDDNVDGEHAVADQRRHVQVARPQEQHDRGVPGMPDQTEDTTRIDPTPRRQPPGGCSPQLADPDELSQTVVPSASDHEQDAAAQEKVLGDHPHALPAEDRRLPKGVRVPQNRDECEYRDRVEEQPVEPEGVAQPTLQESGRRLRDHCAVQRAVRRPDEGKEEVPQGFPRLGSRASSKRGPAPKGEEPESIHLTSR